MDQIKKTFSSTVYHFYHSITNPKVWAAFLMLFTVMFQYFVTNSGASYGTSVFCELFRMKSGSQYYIVYLSLLMIFSELPFDDPTTANAYRQNGKALLVHKPDVVCGCRMFACNAVYDRCDFYFNIRQNRFRKRG